MSQFSNTELIAIIEDLKELKAVRLMRNRKKNIATDCILEKAIKILTRQPDEVPKCKCDRPDWNHGYKNVFCNNCYGFTHTLKG